VCDLLVLDTVQKSVNRETRTYKSGKRIVSLFNTVAHLTVVENGYYTEVRHQSSNYWYGYSRRLKQDTTTDINLIMFVGSRKYIATSRSFFEGEPDSP